MLEFLPFALLDTTPILWPDPGSALGLGVGLIEKIDSPALIAICSALSGIVCGFFVWLGTKSNNEVRADQIRTDATLSAQRAIQEGYDKLVHALEAQNLKLIEHVDGLTKEMESLKSRLGSATLQIERLERTIRDSGLDLPPHNRD